MKAGEAISAINSVFPRPGRFECRGIAPFKSLVALPESPSSLQDMAIGINYRLPSEPSESTFHKKMDR